MIFIFVKAFENGTRRNGVGAITRSRKLHFLTYSRYRSREEFTRVFTFNLYPMIPFFFFSFSFNSAFSFSKPKQLFFHEKLNDHSPKRNIISAASIVNSFLPEVVSFFFTPARNIQAWNFKKKKLIPLLQYFATVFRFLTVVEVTFPSHLPIIT